MRYSALGILVMVGLSSCSQLKEPNSNQPAQKTSSPPSEITSQFLPEICYEYSYGYRSDFCISDEREAVEIAGYIYNQAGREFAFTNDDYRTTVGAAYVNNRWEISSFDTFSNRTEKAFKRVAESRGYHWNEPYSGLHAEQVLYRTYNPTGLLYDIGISNYNGPCPRCQTEVGSYRVSIAWYPYLKWSDFSRRY